MPYSGNKASIDAMRQKYVEMMFGMDVYKEGYDSVKAAVELAQGKDYGARQFGPRLHHHAGELREHLEEAYGSF